MAPRASALHEGGQQARPQNKRGRLENQPARVGKRSVERRRRQRETDRSDGRPTSNSAKFRGTSSHGAANAAAQPAEGRGT